MSKILFGTGGAISPFGLIVNNETGNAPTIYNKVGFTKYYDKLKSYLGKHQKNMSLTIGMLSKRDADGEILDLIEGFAIQFGNIFYHKDYNEAKGWFFTRNNTKKDDCPEVHDKYNNEESKFKRLASVKVKSFEESAYLFGFKPTKVEMMELSKDTMDNTKPEYPKKIEGRLFNISNVLPNFECKKDGVKRDIVEIEYKDRNLKFLIEDLEFVYPDIEGLVQGYNEPKDRKIKVGKTIKIKDSRGSRLPHKYIGKITAIVPMSNNVKLEDGTYMKRSYVEVMYNNKKELILSTQVKVL